MVRSYYRGSRLEKMKIEFNQLKTHFADHTTYGGQPSML